MKPRKVRWFAQDHMGNGRTRLHIRPWMPSPGREAFSTPVRIKLYLYFHWRKEKEMFLAQGNQRNWELQASLTTPHRDCKVKPRVHWAAFSDTHLIFRKMVCGMEKWSRAQSRVGQTQVQALSFTSCMWLWLLHFSKHISSCISKSYFINLLERLNKKMYLSFLHNVSAQ